MDSEIYKSFSPLYLYTSVGMSTWQSVILNCSDADSFLFVDYSVLWHKLYLIGLWHFDKLQTNHWIGLL